MDVLLGMGLQEKYLLSL